jgi:hypothetical protein
MKWITIIIFLFLFHPGICQWQSLDQGLTSFSNDMLYDSTTGLIYVGGYFDYTGDSLRVNSIASWDGMHWDSLAGGVKVIPVVRLIKYQNKLFASGRFVYSNTSDENWLGIWDGNHWDTLDERINGYIDCFKEYNNELYLGGGFNRIGTDTTIHLLAKWDNHTFTSFPFGALADGWAVSAIEFFQGQMYVGGNFYDTITGQPDIEVYDGTAFHSFGGNVLADGTGFISSMVVYQNELYIAGGFHYNDNGQLLSCIMRWDGSQFHDVGGGVDGQVQKMKIINDEIYISGWFSHAGNISLRNWMAKWDGSQWSEVFHDTLDNGISDFNIFNNDLYIAGGFTTINNVPFNHIARYPGYVKVDELSKRDFIINYTNPVTSQLHIEFSNAYKISYELCNIFGEVVISGKCRSDRLNLTTQLLSPGVYIFHASNGNLTSSRKIVVQK